MIRQLRPGMTKAQVQNIVGEPVLINTFDENRWAYVYTYLPGQGKLTEKRLTVFFRNGRVTHFTTDIPRNKAVPQSSTARKRSSTYDRIRAEKSGIK